MKKEYQRNGFCILPVTIPSGVCQQLGTELIQWKLRKTILPNEYGILAHNLHGELEGFHHLLQEYSLLEYAQEIYGRPLLFFQDNLIWKEPSTVGSISWHQDYSYWPLSAPKGITMWIALDDCDRDNGCMLLGAGSHTIGECKPNDFTTNKPAQWAKNLPELHISTGMEHELVLKQGQISVHHPLCAHMSGSNTSTRHRRAWSITFVDEELSWAPQHAPHPYNYWFSVQKGESIKNLPALVSNRNKERYNIHTSVQKESE